MSNVLNTVSIGHSFKNVKNGQFISKEQAGKLVKEKVKQIFNTPTVVTNETIDASLGIGKVINSAKDSAAVFEKHGLTATEKAFQSTTKNRLITKLTDFLKGKNGKIAIASALSVGILATALYLLNKSSEKANPKPTARYVSEFHKVKKRENLWNISQMYLKDKTGKNPTNKEILEKTEEIMKKNNIEYKQPLPSDSKDRVAVIKPDQEIKLN